MAREAEAGQDRSHKQNHGMGQIAIEAQRLPPNVPFPRPGRESDQDRSRPSRGRSNSVTRHSQPASGGSAQEDAGQDGVGAGGSAYRHGHTAAGGTGAPESESR